MTHIVHIKKMRSSKTFKSLKGCWEQNVLDFCYRQRGCQTGTHKTCSQETGSLTGGSFQSFLHQNKNCGVNSGIVLFAYLSLGFWFSLQLAWSTSTWKCCLHTRVGPLCIQTILVYVKSQCALNSYCFCVYHVHLQIRS